MSKEEQGTGDALAPPLSFEVQHPSRTFTARTSPRERASSWNRDVHLNDRLLLGSILVLSAALHLWGLGQRSLWFDEAFVAHVVSHAGWWTIFPILRDTDAHPPLYYLLMKALTEAMGTSEWVLRFPSALFSVASVSLTFALARRLFSANVALLASLFAGVAPLEVMAGQEARMYPLLQMLTLASTWALLWATEGRGTARWAVYVLVSTTMAYTHYLGILVIAAHGLWIVCFSREYARGWSLAAVSIFVAYLPWLPSLWYQTVNNHGWAWYRPHLSWQALGDLAGLYAFGGSLFGMGSYFAESKLSPLEQLIVLAPFAAVFALGITAQFSFHRPSAFLTTILLAVPIGVPLVISLVRPMFYPRWFSFLLPVYAIILASGVLRTGELFAGRKERITALVTIALLLYSIPVLGGYYFDPAYRPYDWRDAAILVEKNAHPGDVFVYTNRAAEISFRYYFHASYPFLVLTPVEALPRSQRHPTFTQERVARLAKKYSRLWIVATVPFTPSMEDRLRTDLEKAYRPVGLKDFGYVWVFLLESKMVSPGISCRSISQGATPTLRGMKCFRNKATRASAHRIS